MSWFIEIQDVIRKHASEHIKEPFVKVSWDTFFAALGTSKPDILKFLSGKILKVDTLVLGSEKRLPIFFVGKKMVTLKSYDKHLGMGRTSREGRTFRRTGNDLVQRSPGCDEACWAHAEKLLHGAKGVVPKSKFEKTYLPWKKWRLEDENGSLCWGDICQFSEVYDLDRNDELWVMSQVCIVLQTLQFATLYLWYHQSQLCWCNVTFHCSHLSRSNLAGCVDSGCCIFVQKREAGLGSFAKGIQRKELMRPGVECEFV